MFCNWIVCYLHIFEIDPTSDVQFVRFFFHSVSCLFTLFSFLCLEKIFSLIQSWKGSVFVGFGEVGEINFVILSIPLIPENTPSELSLRVPLKQMQQKCQDAKTQIPSLLWYHMGPELLGNLPLSQASSFLTPLWHANVIIFYVYLL